LGTGVRTSEGVVVSDAVAVVLRQSALTLVSYDGREPLSLGIGELLLLAALTRTVDGLIDEVLADAEARAGLEPGALERSWPSYDSGACSNRVRHVTRSTLLSRPTRGMRLPRHTLTTCN
jgi:hypothetical protein